jgi:hypothetical protein
MLDSAADFTVLLPSRKAVTELKGALPDAELGAYEWRIYVRSLKP